MIDAFDFLIAGDDAEVEAEIRADAAAYIKYLGVGETDACIRIEKKYGLFGLSPEMATAELAEMATPAGGPS